MWQGLLVGLIVMVAAVYATWALIPPSTRLRLASRLGAWSTLPGRPALLARLAAAIERAARMKLGGCSDCGTASPPRPPSARPRARD